MIPYARHPIQQKTEEERENNSHEQTAETPASTLSVNYRMLTSLLQHQEEKTGGGERRSLLNSQTRGSVEDPSFDNRVKRIPRIKRQQSATILRPIWEEFLRSSCVWKTEVFGKCNRSTVAPSLSYSLRVVKLMIVDQHRKQRGNYRVAIFPEVLTDCLSQHWVKRGYTKQSRAIRVPQIVTSPFPQFMPESTQGIVSIVLTCRLFV